MLGHWHRIAAHTEWTWPMKQDTGGNAEETKLPKPSHVILSKPPLPDMKLKALESSLLGFGLLCTLFPCSAPLSSIEPGIFIMCH